MEAVMESKAKLFGHSIHQMLIVFPLGLLATSLAFDIAFLSTANPVFGLASFGCVAGGICGALLAAFFGGIDWWAIPAGTRAKNIGLLHGVGNVVVVLLFIGSWYMRLAVPDAPRSSAITLSVLG